MQSTQTEWTETEWGEMGALQLATAPFPDDSRTTGFQSRNGLVPREGHYDDSTVVVLVPRGYRKSRDVDLIVHFHGHNNDARNAARHFLIGEQLRASRRNAIVIVPQGPKHAADSGGGKLERPGAFAAFIAELMQVLRSEARVAPDARPGNIVLSAHSGGYRVLAMIQDHGGLSSNIKETWLFDASYGQWRELTAPFESPRPVKRLRSIFTQHLMEANVHLMSNISLADGKFAVVVDDDLTSALPPPVNAASPVAGPGAVPQALSYLLQTEPVLFMFTSLNHDSVMMGRRYFEIFAHESPYLEPTEADATSRTDPAAKEL